MIVCKHTQYYYIKKFSSRRSIYDGMEHNTGVLTCFVKKKLLLKGSCNVSWDALMLLGLLYSSCLSLGNYPPPPNYGGSPGANYSSPGSGMGNSIVMNASSPMHGQGPGQPCGSVTTARGPGHPAGGRPYPAGSSSLAPTSPNMPQSAGPGMGPPPPNVSRKPHESGPASGQQNPVPSGQPR